MEKLAMLITRLAKAVSSPHQNSLKGQFEYE